jgi:hypothetical protein
VDKKTRLNLSESLRSTAIDLTAAVHAVAGPDDDEEAIKRQALILDRIGDDVREGAASLRSMLSRQQLPALPPRRIPPDNVTGIRRVLPD